MSQNTNKAEEETRKKLGVKNVTPPFQKALQLTVGDKGKFATTFRI